MQDLLKNRMVQLIALIAAAAIAMWYFGVIGKARAADKGGKPVAGVVVDNNTYPSWTGFGVDVHGSLATGTADFGAPVNLSVDGQMAGLGAFYNHQFGVLVLGADVNYDRMWGDLHSFGVDYALSIGLRAGLLPSKTTLVYARGEWIRVSGSGDSVDGWGIGGGIETKIAGTPVSLALEWMHDWFDKDKFGPSADVTADRITGRVKFDLYNKPATSLFADR